MIELPNINVSDDEPSVAAGGGGAGTLSMLNGTMPTAFNQDDVNQWEKLQIILRSYAEP